MAKPFLRVEMLPALHGDCLLVEWGDGRRTRRMLIDGGPIGAFKNLQARLAALPDGDRGFELMVLTHVDTDHIDGLVRLFAQPKPWPFVVDDVWFNGWHHLQEAHGMLGGKQGEYFSALLDRRLGPGGWNRAFGGKVVVVPQTGELPTVRLAGGMTLTLLSPTPQKLSDMRAAWEKQLGDSMKPGELDAAWELLAGQKRYLPTEGLLGTTPELEALLEQQSRPDNAKANGSSIAFLAECAGKSCLFLADAHPDAVCASLQRLLAARGLERLAVDAVKVAHHGSKSNTTDALMALIESPRFLFSSNGAQFQHPDREAVQRVIARSVHPRPRLYFNYASDFNREWRSSKLQRELDYRATYARGDDAPLVVRL
ncbi:MAG TPA: hypothetical protein PKA16_06505 [Ottowia sp.]|uniref:ComEC/Rec2 family competence protein n=1 Tax=Ottowia sp. TaxID=1898956 RepID=UPI002C75AFDD|nr:hypothetical protein [Ottowia sp.]HMN21026.1 hypothetical protein [Ottowia sp.]